MEIRFLVFILVLGLFSCQSRPQLEPSVPKVLKATDQNFLIFMANTAHFQNGYGMLGRIDVRTLKKTFAQKKVHTDAAFYSRADLDKVYVINRQGGDSIQVFNKSSLEHIDPWNQRFDQLKGKNPQNIYAVSDREVYVTLHDAPDLVRINLESNDAEAVSLKGQVDGMEQPSLHGLLAYQGNIFVTAQRLDRKTWITSDFSSLIKVDLNGLSRKAADFALREKLQLRNPVSNIIQRGDKGYLACAGDYFQFTDRTLWKYEGIEEISLTNGRSLGIVVTATELNAKPYELAVSSSDFWILSRTDAAGKTQLQKVNRKDKSVKVVETTQSTNQLQGIYYDNIRDLVFVGFREKTQPKILVFDGKDGSRLFAYDVDFLPTQIMLSN